jgi:acetylornithine aminotransferase/acetylornithine/N-succinyldiaminopimelate aminotransferase
MTLASVQRAEKAFLLPTYDRYPVLLTRGRGVYVYDDRGRRYLDFLSGIGVNALGHGHPAVRKALVRQADRLIHVSNLFYHDYQAELAKRLTRISGLDRAFFCNSGAEAWEGALKLARAYARHRRKNGRRPAWRILALENSFHGRTFAALATTGQPKYQKPFAPLVPGVRFVRFNDVADLRKKFDSSVCAIGLETIQGEGGLRSLSPEFLQTARSLSRKHGALLLADEVQCGLGRTGRYFAYQHYGIQPDVVTVAKPLAAGLPLAAILTTDAVARCFHPGMHGSTFGGGPLACAVATAVLDTLRRDGLLQHVRSVGAYLRRRLEVLSKTHGCIREVRGMGLMLGLELDSPELAKTVVRQMLAKGVIVNRTNETVLRLLPPYIISEKHVDQLIARLDQVLSASTRMSPRTKVRG